MLLSHSFSQVEYLDSINSLTSVSDSGVLVFYRNAMSDYGGEVMAEVLAERALVRPQIIPLVPLTNQYRHQDNMDHKDYKSKASMVLGTWIIYKMQSTLSYLAAVFEALLKSHGPSLLPPVA